MSNSTQLCIEQEGTSLNAPTPCNVASATPQLSSEQTSNSMDLDQPASNPIAPSFNKGYISPRGHGSGSSRDSFLARAKSSVMLDWGKFFHFLQNVGNEANHLQQIQNQLLEHKQLEINDLKRERDNAISNSKAWEEQLVKVSRIAMRLGLPKPNDDNYFREKIKDIFDTLESGIRSACYQQSPRPFTQDDFKQLQPSIQGKLGQSFPSLSTHLAAPVQNVPFRWYCLQVIVFTELQRYLLGWPIIGFKKEAVENIKDEFNKKCTKEEIHYWTALTVHLMHKSQEGFKNRMKEEVENITNGLWDQISLLAMPKSTLRTLLKDSIYKIAELGLEIAQLPYEMNFLTPTLASGAYFQTDRMQEMNNAYDPGQLEVRRVQVAIVFTQPLVKREFHGDGNLRGPPTMIAKGRVTCIYPHS